MIRLALYFSIDPMTKLKHHLIEFLVNEFKGETSNHLSSVFKEFIAEADILFSELVVGAINQTTNFKDSRVKIKENLKEALIQKILIQFF